MKKIILLMIITLMAFQFSGCKKEDKSAGQNDGLVNFIAGTAETFADGKSAALNVGDKITSGMTVKTGEKSLVDIQFQGSMIRINEKSSVVMKELARNAADNKESTGLNIENGQVIFKVTRKLTDGEKYRVDTSTAVAAVRGTEFIVTADSDVSRISCLEGKVAVKESTTDDSAFVMVEAGKEAVVEKGKPVVIRNINDDGKAKSKQAAEQKEKQVVVRKEVKAKNKSTKTAEQKKAGDEEIKGAAMIRAEAVKGDIEGKKE